MFKAAIFDMDGLLLDSERPIMEAWLETASRHGIAMTQSTYLQVVGRNAADSKSVLDGLFPVDFPYEVAREQVQRRLEERLPPHGYPAKPGAVALLSLLKQRGVPCCVASSTRVAEIRRRLGLAGLLHFFGSISGGDEVVRGKPDPELFLLAGARLGIAPAHCMVFEDSEYGAAGAMAAGMSVVLVPDLKPPTSEMEARCRAVLPSLAAVLPLCDEWFDGQLQAGE
jgi:HAD superfamily hydrolase (TIGR01509 family)